MSEQIQLFKIRTKARGFKAITAALSSLVDEATLTLTVEEIKIALLDASRKEMIYFLWKKEKFNQYDVSKEMQLTFNVNTLIGIFKRFSNNDEVIMESTTKNTVLFTNPKTEKEFDCNLIAQNKESEKRLDPSYVGEFNLTISQFEEMISDSEVFDAEEAWFESENNKLVFKGGGDSGTTKGILLQEYNQEIKNTAFRFEYLKPFLQSIKPYADENIRMQVGPQKPLHMYLNLGEEIGIMEYFLAPKFE